jgi:hypothetical protein
MSIRKSSISGIPFGNTAARPANPVIGTVYYNGQLEIIEIYNGTSWVANSAPPAVPSITSVTDVGTGLAYATGGTFTIEVAPGSGGSTPLQYNAVTSAGGFSASSSTSPISLTGLTSNTSFIVSANAQNNFGTTVNSNPFSSTLATTVPQAPTIGTATASGSANEVTVTWTLGNTGGKNLSAITITPYLNGTTAETARTAATTSSTSYTFTEGQLTGSASYTFKVKSTNANGVSLESSASNSATMPNFILVDYLVVAGGGGGGGQVGGGGGAGGMKTGSQALAVGNTLTMSVGAGGTSGNSPTQGASSSISGSITVSCTGGGRGGNYQFFGDNTVTGGNGGSGGGGGDSNRAGGTGTSGEGNNGGNSYSGNWSCGGGGGKGGVGGTPTGLAGGAGGAGANSSITGSAVGYAGGGGGAGDYAGGVATHGGGTGGGNSPLTASIAGTANRGGGGGGNRDAANGSPTLQGSPGGSGVIILSLPFAASSTTGSPTSTTSGGRYIYQFNGNGTLTL